jgi:hypothetical protein
MVDGGYNAARGLISRDIATYTIFEHIILFNSNFNLMIVVKKIHAFYKSN